MRGNWQDYYWQDASRGHSAIAELLVGFNRWESVRSFIDRLNLINVLNIARVKFYHHLAVSDNSTLHELLWYYFADHFKKDRCLNDLFFNRNTALHSYYVKFQETCNWEYLYVIGL